MGIEVAFGVAALAIGVISGVNQMNSAAQTTKATTQAVKKEKDAAKQQKEARRVMKASSKVQALEQRRQVIREERFRRAQMLQAAENTGTGGSSGESGAVSALGANLGGMIGLQRSETRANSAVNRYEQKALDLRTDSNAIMANAQAKAAEADAFSSFLNIFSTGLRSF